MAAPRVSRVCRSQPCHRPQSQLEVRQHPGRSRGGTHTPDLGAQRLLAAPYLCLRRGRRRAMGKLRHGAREGFGVPLPLLHPGAWLGFGESPGPVPHGSRRGVTARDGGIIHGCYVPHAPRAPSPSDVGAVVPSPYGLVTPSSTLHGQCGCCGPPTHGPITPLRTLHG